MWYRNIIIYTIIGFLIIIQSLEKSGIYIVDNRRLMRGLYTVDKYRGTVVSRRVPDDDETLFGKVLNASVSELPSVTNCCMSF